MASADWHLVTISNVAGLDKAAENSVVIARDLTPSQAAGTT